jgi:hypothetical protein
MENKEEMITETIAYACLDFILYHFVSYCIYYAHLPRRNLFNIDFLDPPTKKETDECGRRVVSLLHSSIVSLASFFILCFFSRAEWGVEHLQSFSLAYFIFDSWYQSSNLMIAHHIAGIIYIIATHFASRGMNWMYLVFMFFAEITAILQNYYLLMKRLYSIQKQSEYLFYLRYNFMYEVFCFSFISIRSTIFPLFLHHSLQFIQEQWYAILVTFLDISVIFTSMYWGYKQLLLKDAEHAKWGKKQY